MEINKNQNIEEVYSNLLVIQEQLSIKLKQIEQEITERKIKRYVF